MTPERRLAVLVRKTQRLLDEVAYQLAGHQCTRADRDSTAEVLDELAAALRQRPLPAQVIDGTQTE
ncbi:hypothetical protein QFW96_17445 [Saccharopolyspora sp. TS4A08]|uniref:Uncharacterized protein n=1 Tax=Saccharopolyspora ipomoeae TaxID=3042027 RepID=A0ABT6PRG7_9PSEU|nr:hypothetical protein [Saccharopolyspora sp. TS4A08]MDI2030420.1 hypothetical protein [Saccharopolyspora sp. TS4A08]